MCAVLCGFAGMALATEMGGGAYPNGAEGFFAGAVPPPGTYFINYFTYYTADSFNDSSGHSSVPGFRVDAVGNVFRFVHVTNKKVLGGLWGMHVFVPLVNVSVRVPGLSESRFGLGDIIVDPFILSWHSKNWHWATGLDIYVPVGTYDKTHLANPGRNYWTFEPVVGFTFLSGNNFEISCKFMYDINTENNDMDYKSGQEFHLDYAVGKKFGNTTVGLGGYYYTQITDDKGPTVGPDGNKGMVFAIGPQVKYDSKGRSFVFSYQKEISAENRPEGQKFWFKYICAF